MPSPLVHAPMDLPCAHSHYGDEAVNTQALPGQTKHQGIQLLHAALVMPVDLRRRLDRLTFVEPTDCQPDADAVVHENLHAIGPAIGPAIGKQIGMVGMRRTDHLNHSATRGIRACPQVQWLHCQPSTVDANHLSTPADQQANSLAADMGQVMVMSRPPLRTSTLTSHSSGSAGFVTSGKAMNDDTLWPVSSRAVVPVPPRSLSSNDSLSQRCNASAR